MLHNVLAEFLGTGLMIVFGVGVHCDEVLKNSKYRGSGTCSPSPPGASASRWC